MPESKVRKGAAEKQKVKDHQKVVENRAERDSQRTAKSREERTSLRKADRSAERGTLRKAERPEDRASRTLVDRGADRESRRAARVPGQRRWVPPLFITVGLLGVLWLMVYYIAGYQIPQMAKLGNWNILIGMGLMAASFIIATLWK